MTRPILAALLVTVAALPLATGGAAAEPRSMGHDQTSEGMRSPGIDFHEGDNLGNHRARGRLDMVTHQIGRLGDPVEADDAANKRYVDEMVTGIDLPVYEGDNLGDHRARRDLNFGNYEAHSVGRIDMTNGGNIALNGGNVVMGRTTRGGGDLYMNRGTIDTGGGDVETEGGDIDMGFGRIERLRMPVRLDDAASKRYVDEQMEDVGDGLLDSGEDLRFLFNNGGEMGYTERFSYNPDAGPTENIIAFDGQELANRSAAAMRINQASGIAFRSYSFRGQAASLQSGGGSEQPALIVNRAAERTAIQGDAVTIDHETVGDVPNHVGVGLRVRTDDVTGISIHAGHPTYTLVEMDGTEREKFSSNAHDSEDHAIVARSERGNGIELRAPRGTAIVVEETGATAALLKSGNLVLQSGNISLNRGDLNLWNNGRVVNLAWPNNWDDAATKGYVDTAISNVGGGGDDLGNHRAARNLDMRNNAIIGVDYMRTNGYIAMGGGIDMNRNNIYDIGSLRGSGEIGVQSSINMGRNYISNLQNPRGGYQAANKRYVDRRTSDERTKENITPVDEGFLDRFRQLDPVRFDWKDVEMAASDGRMIGFIAQEMERVLPEFVGVSNGEERTVTLADGTTEIVDDPYFIRDRRLTTPIIVALGELADRNEASADRISDLEERLAALEARNAKLLETLSRERARGDAMREAISEISTRLSDMEDAAPVEAALAP